MNIDKEAQAYRDAQPRCKGCNHFESFHNDDGCGTWLLGVRAVPMYRCACVHTPANMPKSPQLKQFPVITNLYSQPPYSSTLGVQANPLSGSSLNSTGSQPYRPSFPQPPQSETITSLAELSNEIFVARLSAKGFKPNAVQEQQLQQLADTMKNILKEIRNG